ncbi:MAG: hypothetical protein U1G05_13220 [Kiritimatiellia bacterium]
MPRIPLLFPLILAVGTLSAVAETAAPANPDAQRVRESRITWEKLRDGAGGDYTYQVPKVFMMSRETTTVVVKGNKVVERTFEESGPPRPSRGVAPPAPAPKWVEKGADVGTHKGRAPPPSRWTNSVRQGPEGRGKARAEHEKRYVETDERTAAPLLRPDTRIADDAPTEGVPALKIQISPKPRTTRWCFLLLMSAGLVRTAGAAEAAAPAQKVLPIPGEVFLVRERPAFLILPEGAAGTNAILWVWYAPTLPNLPGREEAWLLRRFREAGVAVAGIDVGESYGSPDGRARCSRRSTRRWCRSAGWLPSRASGHEVAAG